jgi:hypothetical protein
VSQRYVDFFKELFSNILGVRNFDRFDKVFCLDSSSSSHSHRVFFKGIL